MGVMASVVPSAVRNSTLLGCPERLHGVGADVGEVVVATIAFCLAPTVVVVLKSVVV